nr:hypothetical protein CFP56_69697 [Quercus suber]
MADAAKRLKLLESFQSPKKKNHVAVTVTHVKTPNKTSNSVNDTPPAAGNAEIILQSFADRIDGEGICLELLHKDVVANLVELWRSFKAAEFECKLQEARFREELLNAAVISSTHTNL